MEALGGRTATERLIEGHSSVKIKPVEKAHSLSTGNIRPWVQLTRRDKSSFRKQRDLGLEKTAVNELP